MLQGEELAVSLLRGNWLYFPAICWRTKAAQAVGFDPTMTVIQDLSLIIQLVEQGAKLAVSDQVAFQYRRHAVSASSATAISGSRFAEARNYFLDTADAMTARGWNQAAKAARRHLSSRLHALTLLPGTALHGNVKGVRTLTKHAFGRGRT